MSRLFYPRPLLPLTICLAAGILLGEALPGFPLPAWVSLICGIIGLFFSIRRRRNFIFPPLLFSLAFGYLSIQPWVAPSFSAHHIIHSVGQTVQGLAGVIHSSPQKQDRRLSFILRVESIDGEAATGLLRVSAWGQYPEFSEGDRVIFSAKIREIRNFANPGGFDYERFMAFQKIWASASVRKKSLRLLEKGKEPLFEQVRGRFSEIITRTASLRSGAILRALVIGDRASIEPSLREQFSRAGISHLLAISGLHLSIVFGFSFFCFRWLFSRIEFFLWRGWVKRASLLVSLIPVVAYGWMSGMSPSTQRAILMILAGIICLWQTRPPDIASIIALAAMVVLLVHPPTLFSISFQLSFSAVIAIVYGLSRFLRPAPGNAPASERIKMWGAGFVLVSFFAILGTLPFVMHYFYQASFTGMIANIIYVPLVGWMVLPLGLSAFCFSLFSEPLAEWALRGGSSLLDFGLNCLPFFSELPFCLNPVFPPNWLEIACYYVVLWCLIEWVTDRKKAGEGRAENAGSSGWLRMGVAAIVCLILIGDGVYWLHHRYWHKDLRMTVIDVGQGTSVLLEFPGGKTLLADGGGFYSRSTFDVGERLVGPYLLHQRILTLDAVVLTHPDSDHLNGLLYILERFDVREFWSTHLPAESYAYSTLLKILEERQIPHPLFQNLPRKQQWGAATVEVLYPPADIRKRVAEDAWRLKSNNGSIVLRAQLGGESLLIPGDIEAPAEKELVKIAGDRLKSTVLVAPHHGSKTSSTSGFLSHVKPEYILISAGWKNRFRCPHKKVMKRYAGMEARIFRTDLDGAIQLSINGEREKVRTKRK